MRGSAQPGSRETRKAALPQYEQSRPAPRQRHVQFDVLHMIKRRAGAAGVPYSTCCHTFRATGITTYLRNGGTLEHAQTIANHESPTTTKLYDRTREELTFEEVERVKI
jgi:integrase/recombinase XerD